MQHKTRFNMPISRLLILGGILIAALPVALLAIGYTIKTRSLLLTSTLEHNQVLAKEAALYVDRLLSNQRNVLNLTAQELGAEGLDPTLAVPVLQRVRAQFPLFERLLAAPIDGVVSIAEPALAETGQRVAGVNIADRNYFQTVIRTKAPFVDPSVLLGRSSGKPIMIMAAPLTGPTGEVLGVLAGTIDLGALTDLIGRLNVGTTGHAVAVTRDGIAVAHPNGQLVQERFDFSKRPIWRFLGKSDEGLIHSYVDEINQNRFAAFATVPLTGWKLWFSQQHAEVDAEFLEILLSSGVWPITALIAGIILAFLLSLIIARPVEKLHDTAEQIASGHLEVRAPEEGPTELASLAVAVNAMAKSLQERIDEERAARAALECTVTDYGAFAEKVAAGDFSAQVAVDNAGGLERLGDGLNAMSRSLGLLVGEIKLATTQLGSASSEILAATSQQAAATTEEAAAVRQMAASVHELRQAGDSVARRTQAVLDMAQKTEAVADTGLQSVEETIRSAEEGRQRLETLAERVMGFSERTYEIAEINATVGELAEKSNLLAVNASIEAAKAGEAGRGFAVVANEVKELAEQSKAATAQVRRIIADIQRSAQAAVIAAEQYAKASDAGVSTARQSGASISTLAGRVTEASQAARQNLAAAEQQQAGIEQIALAVDNIETSSAQTVSATSQVEQSARSLHDLAQSLEAIVSRVEVRPAPEQRQG